MEKAQQKLDFFDSLWLLPFRKQPFFHFYVPEPAYSLALPLGELAAVRLTERVPQ